MVAVDGRIARISSVEVRLSKVISAEIALDIFIIKQKNYVPFLRPGIQKSSPYRVLICCSGFQES
jgi:hypothetical protein